MASGKTEVSIDRSPDDVWKLLREFGSLAEWMPGVETCTLEGDVRTLGMMGMEIKEQLRELDDDARRISYSIVQAPMPNLESHLATLSVEPEGTSSRFTWTVDVSPDELVDLFVPIYEGAAQEVKKKLES
jgi:carbon monoxide dehydrogenase subunit G